MLTYLDALIDALTIRDGPEIRRLLDHPLARILPPAAREEAALFGVANCDPLAAPLRVMQLRHQTAELLRDAPVIADRVEAAETVTAPRKEPPLVARRAPRMVQMELPLSA